MASPNDRLFHVLTNYLKIISLLFALMGVYWALSGMFDPFGIYDTRLARAFWDRDVLPREAEQIFRFVLGPLGATCTGYFLMQFFLAKNAFANREMWGYKAVVIPFLIWFLLDTTVSLFHKAWFNVCLANLPAFAAMIPVFLSYPFFTSPRKQAARQNSV